MSISCRIVFSLALGFLLPNAATAQMQSGSRMQNYDEVFGVKTGQASYDFAVRFIDSSAPGNILFPGEQPTVKLAISNLLKQPLALDGKVDVMAYGTHGIPGDVWLPVVYKIADLTPVPIHLDIKPGGTQEVDVTPTLSDKMGGYALIVDLGSHGRRFATSLARTFAATTERIQYPKMSLDANVGLDALNRLGVQAIRLEVSYIPTDAPDYATRMADLDKKLKDYADKNITVMAEMDASTDCKQPMDHVRPYLNDKAEMLPTKFDNAWLPEQDPDFRKFVTQLCARQGWPKGPLTSVCLYNEPWEGISIAGWGADMLRYREMYTQMALGVEDARAQGVQVLIGGCDSSTNAWDKLFSDGTDKFLKWFDFCSIHYQGISAPSLFKLWLNRQGPNGRVRIWDTESWVANTDDRIATTVAFDRAAGYDRSMGVFHGNVHDLNGNAWSPAASVGAVQHFIGEREFHEFLFQKGLPWIMVFDGLKGNSDDGTVVIVGDLADSADGPDHLLFRGVRGLNEPEVRTELQKKLDALPANAPERAVLEKELANRLTLTGGSLSMPATPGAQVFDFYGNPVPTEGDQVKVPLDFRGFYLRTDGSPGSFAKLLDGLRGARIEGYEPLNVVVHDFVKPFSQGGQLRLTLSNILNRAVSGSLQVTIGDLKVDAPANLSFTPFETKEIMVAASGAERSDNMYPMKLHFDAGADGRLEHDETVRVNEIARRTITVDGSLDDWKGALPQSVQAKGNGAPSLTEAAWLPFKNFDTNLTQGFATGYLAYDENYFYFAAKVSDATPDEGTYRFESRDDDSFFYPDVSYLHDPAKTFALEEKTWDVPGLENYALISPGGGPTDRNLHLWQSTLTGGCFAYDIDLPVGPPTRLAFYLLDPDKENLMGRRGQSIRILDRTSGKILAQQNVSQFGPGKYVLFQAQGPVRVVVTGPNNDCAVLSAIFFDTPEKPVTMTGTAAKYIGLDADTHGEWKGKYGQLGYDIAGAAPHLPAGMTMTEFKAVDSETFHWPDGVRHYSYRRDPILPSGNSPNFDNVQIAFNVLPPDQKETLPAAPGTMPGFVPTADTDYEYALNKIAQQYGGGTEIWRLKSPGMPFKGYYPRQPKCPQDGPVSDSKLVYRQVGNTRIVEAAIPWSEIPEVKAVADAGKTIKFSFRVNDDHGIGMELAEGRSVSKLCPYTFHQQWWPHWGNEVEFGFEKK